MLNKRILAFGIDFCANILLMFIISFIPVPNSSNKVCLVLYGVALIVCTFILLFKDAFGGQSLGKRVIGIRVVSSNGCNVNPFRLILRNVTIFIWPIEGLLILLDKKRIGDVVAGTEICEV